MHKNSLFLSLLLMIAIAAIYFTMVATWKVQHYNSLSAKIKVESVKWNSFQASENKFFVTGAYEFKLNDQTYRSESMFNHEPLKNQYAVFSKIEENKKKEWVAHYNPNNPDFSTIDYRFPYGVFLSAGTLLAIFFYLVFIGFYVKRFNP